MKMTATCGIEKFRWREKNKTLVKILGGRQHRTTPAASNIGGRDPCNPCGVDAYGRQRSTTSRVELKLAAATGSQAQTRAVRSLLADTRNSPACWNTTHWTASSWPINADACCRTQQPTTASASSDSTVPIQRFLGGPFPLQKYKYIFQIK